MSNTLFPIFLKTEHLRFLIIGGGNVGHEKAETLLRQNPETKIKIIAKTFGDNIKKLIRQFSHIEYQEKEFDESDLENIDIIIAATDNNILHQRIKQIANSKNILVNVADQPDLCDFYLGSIVKKGDLKLAISTNGKSPTIAKRLRETLDENIPNDIDEVLNNLHNLRNYLSGDFRSKLEILNTITASLSDNPEDIPRYLEYISRYK
ncbi:bifunctional precorrin-2 dehydrogenase/sirohydrochlorin ferrochelatase [Chryseobacterium sp.]|uniref:precorrin-2 dehydrogenase/sirohydrochlorin ferrochelatase family protein n=1 Tax=Chryseobacterium sp. TaxID=1871047 RepID=UPI0025C4A3EE|nr:bifunctional precorrin-2 dehydrogenase/sirohydrochlorin ferrochelatase [Chryseobacterium sp.]